MVRSYPLRASVGGVLLVALLLTGCGAEDDDAAASPSSTVSTGAPAASSSSSEPGSGATPADYVPASLDGPAQNVPEPVMPDLAREESREGAQAFLDYWSDAMWYAHQTGDTSYVRTIVSKSCEVCDEQLDFIEDVHADNAWFIGGKESPVIQEVSIQRSAEGIYKPIVLASAAGVQLVESGTVTYEASPRSGEGDPFPVYMDYVDGAWIYITAANMPGVGPSNG
jgi:hypothetical protein